jgi:hypothetical protein
LWLAFVGYVLVRGLTLFGYYPGLRARVASDRFAQ